MALEEKSEAGNSNGGMMRGLGIVASSKRNFRPGNEYKKHFPVLTSVEKIKKDYLDSEPVK